MQKLILSAPGVVSASCNMNGKTGRMLLQAEVTSAATFRVMQRHSPEMPWLELWSASSAPRFQSLLLVPHIQLEMLSGTGTVTLWVAEP